MAISIKSSKDGKRQYRYLQHSVRVSPTKVKTKSVYLGPVNPIRKRKPGVTVGEVVSNILMGGLAFAAAAAKGKLATPHYKSAPYDEGWRQRKVLDDQLRQLDQHYAIDRTNAERFNETRGRLPAEMQEEYARAEMALWRAYHADKERHQPKAEISPGMKELSERIAARGAVNGPEPAADATGPDADNGESET